MTCHLTRSLFTMFLLTLSGFILGVDAYAQSSGYHITVSPTTVAPGGTITVSWQAPGTHSSRDWIGLFYSTYPSAGNTTIETKYVPGGTSGTMTFTAPKTSTTYQLRYLLDNGYTEAVRSSTITVTTAPTSGTAPAPAAPSTTAPSTTSPSTYGVSAGTTTVAPGASITVSWTAPSTHSAKDWIGLFYSTYPSAGNTTIEMKYVPSGTSGTMTFTAPKTATTYQLRYLLNDGYTEAVRSTTITVTTTPASGTAPAPTTPSPTSPSTYSVSAGMSTVAPGSPITVTWTAPSNHAAKDWIGLFYSTYPSAGNTTVALKYVPSGTGGTMTFMAPSTASSYQLRYLLNDGFTEAARSSTITVTAATSGIPSSPTTSPSPSPAPAPTSPTNTTDPTTTPTSPSPTPAAGPCPNGKPIAFPGAEGFGRCTQGGRGGRVIEVTTLNNSGPGSLRQCAEVESGPRTCVFRVSGTIALGTYDIVVRNPFLTIAGQTAPGAGIALKDGGLNIKANEVIVRHLRVRPGSASFVQRGVNANGISIQSNEGVSIQNIIIDHCSVSWGTDDLVYVIFGTDNVTIQWSIMSEGLVNCGPECGGKAFLMAYGARSVSFHHNLSVHNFIRWPEVSGGGNTTGFIGRLDFVNNVQYNGNGSDTVVDPYHGPIYANFVGNYWQDGLNAIIANLGHNVIRTMGGLPYSNSAGVHVAGNIGRNRLSDGLPQTNIIWGDNGGLALQSTRYAYPPVTTTDAFTARAQVLARAGATLPARDPVDRRVVNDVTNGVGTWIRSPADVGGWPLLASGTPPVDTDHDGMPDAWETNRGLNPNDPLDGPRDRNGDGYTNLEEYLNSAAQ